MAMQQLIWGDGGSVDQTQVHLFMGEAHPVVLLGLFHVFMLHSFPLCLVSSYVQHTRLEGAEPMTASRGTHLR